jgi:CO/xanthine dehydrogenase Mo-binding subunit
MVVGGLLRCAAQKLKQAVEQHTGSFPDTRAGLRKVARKLCDGKEEVSFEAQYQKPPGLLWDEETHKGDAYGVFSYAAVVADVEIDKLTYEVRVRDLATAVEVGRAINPLFVEGQVMGGTAQALGYALLENAVYENGVMQNAGLTNYVIPTTLDTPPLSAEILEKPYSRGPFGAKGVGELPMDGPAPAIAAAVYNATGRLITSLPLLPERIFRAGND